MFVINFLHYNILLQEMEAQLLNKYMHNNKNYPVILTIEFIFKVNSCIFLLNVGSFCSEKYSFIYILYIIKML